MQKEIGGYFELEYFGNNHYYKNLIALNNARNCLYYLIKAKNIEKIYIPYYLCDSISNMCERHKITYEYYQINSDFMPQFEKKLGTGEFLYIVNYFGQIDNDKIKKLKEKYIRIILDNSQAFFQKPELSVDTIYSCRKFFGVPDGGYLSTNVLLNEELEISVSFDRMTHILGRYEGNASDYYNDFEANDKRFDNDDVKLMSKLTQNLLGAINYRNTCKKREKNFNYLHSRLGEKNGLDLINPIGPYCYPFFFKNGYELKRKLIYKKIYVPTLWPNVIEITEEKTIENEYAKNIIPIPCDQRYSEGEMEYILKKLYEVMM